MPCYQLVLLARPDITPDQLSTLFRSIARVIYRENGQFRTLQNLGVRPLAYPVRKGGQKFEEVRWVQALYDCAPPALASVGSAIQSEKGVLQYQHLRHTGPLAAFSPAFGSPQKLKRFSTAMRFNSALFDPDTLRVKQPGELA
jgi:ribosomal protein S6